MKARARLALVLALFALAGVLTLALTAPARALPEYSAQTGEPCATCHSSPSGGGIRTPRGQAWVADARPGTVPALNDALALLGVKLTVNEADFVAPSAPPPAPAQPVTSGARSSELRQWLHRYEGN
jgi:hypothetical protein